MSYFLSSQDAPTTPDKFAESHAQWEALWTDVLRVHLGGPSERLKHHADTGWVWQDPVHVPLKGLFGLYKPLLDARSVQRYDVLAKPWLVAQLGQSLDGFIATATGDSFFVNGEACLLHLHRLRALCDAVLVGAGTVAADNPQLTTRKVAGPQPIRVVIDAQARLDGSARVFQDGQAPTLWVCDALHAPVARERLKSLARACSKDANTSANTARDSHQSAARDAAFNAVNNDVNKAVNNADNNAAHIATTHTVVNTAFGAAHQACEVLAVPGLINDPASGGYAPQRVIDALALRGLRLLFVEGGGLTVSRFFAAQALHRLHLAIAPVFIGQGRRGLQAQATNVMADCLRPPARTLNMGDDVLWDLALKPDLKARQ